MALARGGWAVLLAEGTLQEQLREREGGETVAAGIAESIMVSRFVVQSLQFDVDSYGHRASVRSRGGGYESNHPV